MAEQITDANFEEKTKTGNWIVDFWAAWCGPCQVLGPVIDELAAELEGKVNVGKLNVDENKQISMAAGIQSIPAIVFIKDGQEVDRLVGALPKETILEKASEVFGI